MILGPKLCFNSAYVLLHPTNLSNFWQFKEFKENVHNIAQIYLLISTKLQKNETIVDINDEANTKFWFFLPLLPSTQCRGDLLAIEPNFFSLQH